MNYNDELKGGTKGMRYYAGIGSRKTPPEVLSWMRWLGTRLERAGYTLRSGGAKGADSAFEGGVREKREIFLPQGNIPNWCFERVQKYIPKGRNWDSFRPFVKKLLARNMMQIWGRDGNTPVDFVICWTPKGIDDGGTGYAVRAAWDAGIPVYNLRNEEDKDKLRELIRRLIGSKNART